MKKYILFLFLSLLLGSFVSAELTQTEINQINSNYKSDNSSFFGRYWSAIQSSDFSKNPWEATKTFSGFFFGDFLSLGMVF